MNYFPHKLNFDLANRSKKQNEKLFDELAEKPGFNSLQNKDYQDILSMQQDIKQAKPDESRQDFKERIVTEKKLLNFDKMAYMDHLFTSELKDNIIALKQLNPPIHMVTPAHLAYNGMMGHAPAIDDGSFITNLIARKVYSIRVSDDPLYQGQWKGLFYSIPGPNKFGKTVLNDLASNQNGHQILLDLKHSDFLTRKYFFDSLMIKYQLPPICSHCAVTGLSDTYYSPFNDEYNILRANFTTTLYPFGINLYDEEIIRICDNDGIIGIPFEQRVLRRLYK